MRTYSFDVHPHLLQGLLAQYPNLEKNSHVGKIAVELVKLFFLSKDPDARFAVCRDGGDLEVRLGENVRNFEIKGTADATICWPKLKVSSHACHNALINGMELIRESTGLKLTYV